MPIFLRCPECEHRFRLPSSTTAAVVRCPSCDARVDTTADEDRADERRPSTRRARRPRRSRRTKILVGVLAGCGVLVVLCAGGIGVAVWRFLSPTSFPSRRRSMPRPGSTSRPSSSVRGLLRRAGSEKCRLPECGKWNTARATSAFKRG